METASGTWQVLTTQNSPLPANHVTDICEDAGGNLWFATYGGGLCRRSADGREWTTHRAADGRLVNDLVGLVAVDAADRVWAVCDARKTGGVEYPGGICVLSPDGTGQVYARSESDECIIVLEPDRDGTVWFRTGGMVLGDDCLTRCDGMRDGDERYHGQQWLALDGATWTSYEGDRAALTAWYPHRPAHTRLGWALEGDTVWLLETVRPPALDMKIEIPGLPFPFPGSLGLFGMGSFACDYYLSSYDGQEWKQIEIPGSFRYGELVVDSQGHKWVSLVTLGDIVMGAGMARFDGQEWTVFDNNTGLPSMAVMAVSADSRGNVWVSDHIGGLGRWDGSSWTGFSAEQIGHGHEALGRAVEDRQGRLWFRSRSGVIVYTP